MSQRVTVEMYRRARLVIAAMVLSAIAACAPGSSAPNSTDPTNPSVGVVDTTGNSASESAWVLVATAEGEGGLPPPWVIETHEDAQLYADQLASVDVDFAEQVIFMLSIPRGIGCQEEVRLSDLIIDWKSGIVYGDFVRNTDDPECVGVLGSFTFYIATDRDRLPGEFSLQAEDHLTHPQAVSVHVVLND